MKEIPIGAGRGGGSRLGVVVADSLTTETTSMRSIHKLGQLSAGQVLRADGLISTAQLQEIHDEQAATRESVVEIAMARGLVTEFDVAKAMVRHLHLPYVSPMRYAIGDDVKAVLPAPALHNHMVIPFNKFGKLLVIATDGDLSSQATKELESESGCSIAFVIALRSEIQKTLNKEFPMENLGQEVASRLDELFGS